MGTYEYAYHNHKIIVYLIKGYFYLTPYETVFGRYNTPLEAYEGAVCAIDAS